MSMPQRSIAVSTTRRTHDSTPFRSHARSELLDDDVVAPVVAEVIDVEKPLDAPIDEGSQADPCRVVDLALEELVVRKLDCK